MAVRASGVSGSGLLFGPPHFPAAAEPQIVEIEIVQTARENPHREWGEKLENQAVEPGHGRRVARRLARRRAWLRFSRRI